MEQFPEISWKLSCSQKEAFEILSNSVDPIIKPALFGSNYFKGIFNGNDFTIWPKTLRFCWIPLVICSGQVLKAENNGSNLIAKMRIRAPLKYIALGWKSLSILIPLSVISLAVGLLGFMFESFEFLKSIGLSVGITTMLIILFGFGKYMGDQDLLYFQKHFDSIFGKYRI